MAVQERTLQPHITNDSLHPEIDRIYHAWDEALSKNDARALLALYAPDAVLESPLVSHLLGTEKGICRGHEDLKNFSRSSPLANRR
jgi:ketosteroid isomerase-like protein